MDILKDFIDANPEKFHQFTDEEMKKMHQILLGMIDDILEFCRIKNLTLYASGGTALGVIRHKGFIPWDEDVDFSMPRKDCNILLSDFVDFYKGKYFIEAPNSRLVGNHVFIKIKMTNTVMTDLLTKKGCSGFCVDIFPIDSTEKMLAVAKETGAEMIYGCFTKTGKEPQELEHCMLEDFSSVVVETYAPRSTSSIHIEAEKGYVSKLYCCATGKVFLAHMKNKDLQRYLAENELTPMTRHTITEVDRLLSDLEDIREKGYSVEMMENENHIISLGAPIFNSRQEILAALGIMLLSHTLSERDIPKIGESLREATQKISRTLGANIV